MMGRILDDYVCEQCGEMREAYRDTPPRCCRDEMTRMPGGHNFEWGGPRTYPVLRDEPFASRSEKQQWARDAGLFEMGDKEGGARNEDHRNLGKIYSHPGAPTRSVAHRRYDRGGQRQ